MLFALRDGEAGGILERKLLEAVGARRSQKLSEEMGQERVLILERDLDDVLGDRGLVVELLLLQDRMGERYLSG